MLIISVQLYIITNFEIMYPSSLSSTPATQQLIFSPSPPQSSPQNRRATFESNFDPKRNDLFYGRAAGAYYQKFRNKFEGRNDQYYEWLNDPERIVARINLLNDALIYTIQKRYKHVGNIIQININPEEIKKAVMKQFRFKLFGPYLEMAFGNENKKFNIVSVFQETMENHEKTKYHIFRYGENPAGIMFDTIYCHLWWVRGSKLGLELAAQNIGFKIHYFIDGIDFDKVVKKEGEEGNSISSKELRYIFRIWDRIKNDIHFYEEGIETPAPWIDNPKLWDIYKQKNKQKKQIENNSTSNIIILEIDIERFLRRPRKIWA